MTAVSSCSLPETALLRKCEGGGAYTDCYVTEVAGMVSQQAFVEAFYTTALFRVERAILGWLVDRPSTDIGAARLAAGETDSFAAWRVEDRSADQLLLADYTGRTKSWLMAAPVIEHAAAARTRLYFGSAIVPRADAASGKRSMGVAFRALLGFHRQYSLLLLRAARSRVLARP